MITFPPEFVTTRYPGYFWNTASQRLFTIKVHGVLRELKITNPSKWNNFKGPYYKVSVRSVRKSMGLDYLKSLKSQEILVEYK